MTQDKFRPIVQCAALAVGQLKDLDKLSESQVEIMAIQLERLLDYIQPYRKES